LTGLARIATLIQRPALRGQREFRKIDKAPRRGGVVVTLSQSPAARFPSGFMWGQGALLQLIHRRLGCGNPLPPSRTAVLQPLNIFRGCGVTSEKETEA